MKNLTFKQARWLLHYYGSCVYWGNMELKEFAAMENREKLYRSLPAEIKRDPEKFAQWDMASGVAEKGVADTLYYYYKDTRMDKGARVFMLYPDKQDAKLAGIIARIYAYAADKEDYEYILGEKLTDQQLENNEIDHDLVGLLANEQMMDKGLEYIDPYDDNGYHLGQWFGFDVFETPAGAIILAVEN